MGRLIGKIQGKIFYQNNDSSYIQRSSNCSIFFQIHVKMLTAATGMCFKFHCDIIIFPLSRIRLLRLFCFVLGPMLAEKTRMFTSLYWAVGRETN